MSGNRGNTRRSVLKAGLALAATPALGAAGLRRSLKEQGRTLVLLQLAGGNDGLNTFIPYTDPLYRELRPRLSQVAEGALPISDRLALHPGLSPLLPLYRRGRMAIVQGVGYAEPDYSHTGSQRIWLTGSRDNACTRCWWDGALAQSGRTFRTAASQTGSRIPTRTDVGMPPAGPGELRRTLRKTLRVVASHRPPAVIFASMGGFDTHIDQLPAHAHALGELAESLADFMADLEAKGLRDRVLLAAWSEFGRRIAENADHGTDHGSAGPVFLLGGSVPGGIYGQTPSLSETDYGNLIATTDFRDVYAALANWLRDGDTGGLAYSRLLA